VIAKTQANRPNQYSGGVTHIPVCIYTHTRSDTQQRQVFKYGVTPTYESTLFRGGGTIYRGAGTVTYIQNPLIRP
jgi:hypothetical protein